MDLPQRADVSARQSEVARNAEAANLVGAKLVRLTAGWDLDKSGRDLGNEAACDLDSGSSSSLIAVQEQYNLLEALLQKLLLPGRKRTSHQ